MVPGRCDIELFMNWFRENPNLNKHYECWNTIYNNLTVDPRYPDRLISRDRRGEMFVYMHRQMLARYDAERLGLNLPLTKPLDDYHAPIQEGYKPNKNLATYESTTYESRKANSVINSEKINDMEISHGKIKEAIEAGQFYDDTKIDINLLGAVVSPLAAKENYYGSLHATGHINIAYINNNNNPGVMSNPRVASRDPVFWRWHRHLDNLINKWEEKQEPNNFLDSPPVKLQDVILAFKNELPISHGETKCDHEAIVFGEKTFGGKNFDTDVSNNKYVTNELQTRMKSRFSTHSGLTEDIDYLFLREFYYFFRVENTSSSRTEVTFRVFLVPEELAESRRHWIELDKFKQTLNPKSKMVVHRDSDMSSVVRQPPQKTRDELNDTINLMWRAEDVGSQSTSFVSKSQNIFTVDIKYKDCGWPYHLLLPRGRRGGMNFKLLVFISDWSAEGVPVLRRYGSVSFCGGEKLYSRYPDRRPMGYPLDRPFKNNSYKETFAGLNNAIIRDVSINWVDEWQEVFDDGKFVK